jgi:predicted MPP superfamily phosphohydrolase
VLPLIDLLFGLTFFAVQWRISRILLRLSTRWKDWRRTAAKSAIFLFDGGLLIGYAFTFSDYSARLGAQGPIPAMIGAVSLAYCLIATGVLAICELVGWIGRRLNVDADPNRRRLLRGAGATLAAAPFATIGYGMFIERSDFRVREVDLPFAGLPPGLDGLRILQVSDIHLSPFLSEAELARVIDAALGLHPHVTVVTGDLISSQGDPLDACIRQLARLKADAGVFGCMGNHERYAHAEDYTAAACARLGIEFLRHHARRLRFGPSVLNLAGVDYQSLAGRQQYLRGAEQMLAPDAFNVLLSHNPDVFPVAARQGYNLVIAGHTHGGQVTVEILDRSINPARFFTPYVYGVHRRHSAAIYVTRGIGTIGLPARIGAPPEISLLRLRKA